MTAEERELDKIIRGNIVGYQDMPIVVKAGIIIACQQYARQHTLATLEKAKVEIEEKVSINTLDEWDKGYNAGIIEAYNILTRCKSLIRE